MNRRRTRVLLVEDNPLLERKLSDALAGIDLVEVAHVAATRADAVDWLDRHRDGWDLAVVDIFLREGHGFDVLRHCADRPPGRRVVVLTNYTRDPMRASAAALGADAVFDKSFELDAFLEDCDRYARGLRVPAAVTP
ncbi:MAG: response regulator [Comamonadaceae bacterium]|nr:MAG: response regulator [Comamonadaceae bacterium]